MVSLSIYFLLFPLSIIYISFLSPSEYTISVLFIIHELSKVFVSIGVLNCSITIPLIIFYISKINGFLTFKLSATKTFIKMPFPIFFNAICPYHNCRPFVCTILIDIPFINASILIRDLFIL